MKLNGLHNLVHVKSECFTGWNSEPFVHCVLGALSSKQSGRDMSLITLASLVIIGA